MRKLHKLSLLAMLMFVSIFYVNGQNESREKADMQFKLKAYDLAIESYENYLELNRDDVIAMTRLAKSYERSNELIAAARWYEKVIANPKHSPYNDISYGKLLMKLGLYEKAETQFAKMKSVNATVSQQYINSCKFAKNILALGDKYILSQMRFSSPFDDFAAEANNGDIIFCSFKQTSNNQSLVQRSPSSLNIYNSSTREVAPYKSGLNKMDGIGPIRFSPSGKLVVYTRNSFVNGTQQITGEENDMSIYIAEVGTDGEFVDEKALPCNGIDYSVAFACFGADDDEIYYSSNKNGRNFDIYRANKVNGEWNSGIALDKSINTFGNEITPYYSDGTLYFSSDYLNGLGGYDVFKSTVYNGEVSFPVNLGKGVNSPTDDLYYMKKANSSIGYVTSNRLGSKGGYDIYSTSPLSINKTEELVYDYIPEAVKINNMDKNGVAVKLDNNIVNVSLNSTSSSEVTLDGAKFVAYDDVILSPSRVYFIQLASLSRNKVNGKRFKKLTKYGNVYKVHKGRTTKVRLGYFVSESEAKAVLTSVRRKGFRDAFIVEDLLNSSELELLESSYSFGNNKKYDRPSSISDYKIKLAAYSNPLYFDVNKVKDLGVIEQWSKGKWTIFILSGYTNYNDALVAMRKARNRGYTTAEVVVDDNGILSKVKTK